MSDPDWWRGAVIYQIYPRSFQDSNNDGIGDLKGITQKLDHIANLGVDGIWISPFFASPMKDFGYDVSNYRDVDPLFGTLADFDALLNKARTLKLKVIIDLVLSHTSDQHPWFSDPAKKDWYVWADAKIDNTGNRQPPNNWVSVFGGSAWEWSDAYNQYYLHNFLKEQPDLNFYNEDVQLEVFDICRFWLDRGVDGFRLDVVNFYFHDPLLRDNPSRETGQHFATQLEADVPYSRQHHIYDKSRPENIDFIRKFRALLDEYPDKMGVGEIGDDDPTACAIAYTRGEKLLHTSYNTSLMSGTYKPLTPNIIRNAIEDFENQAKSDIELDTSPAWPSWAFSNHDVVRAASRWYAPYDHAPAFSKMLIALLGCLRGTLFLYQGEELGLPEAQIPFESLQDPWAKETYPVWQGRDGCRTPLPWTDEKPFAGFSSHKPWLPLPETHYPLNVQQQNEDKNSVLHFTQHFLNWRKTNQNLVKGEIEFVVAEDCNLLHFIRHNNKNKTNCIFNISDIEISMPDRIIAPYGFHIDGYKPQEI